MQIIGSNNPTRYINGTTDADFTLSVTETPLSTGGTSTNTTVKDAVVTTTNNAGVLNYFRLKALTRLDAPREVTITNVGSSNCVIDAAGNVTLSNPLVSSNASFDVAVRGVGKRNYTRTISNTSQTVQSAAFTVANSLAKHITDSMTSLVAGKTPNDATRAAFNADGSRNTNAWCESLDFSAIGVQAVYGNPAELVTPRHIISCNHAGFNVGEQFTFKNKSGVSETRTIVSTSNFGELGGDLRLYLLNQAVTVTQPFKILPTNWAAYLPSVGLYANSPLPVLHRQNVREVANDYFTHYTVMALTAATTNATLDTYTTGVFNGWSSKLVGGDSGSPAFLVINNQPVLIGVTYTGAFSGDWLANTALNAQVVARMRSLAAAAGDNTAYDFSYVSLAGFTTY